MTIELIPVIEIFLKDDSVVLPEKQHYWENAELWAAYHEECYSKAGFKDKLVPYLKGSCFYRVSDIPDDCLAYKTKDHTQQMRDGEYERAQACAFFGGYVLRIDGQDKYFPQCCGQLSDIKYWESLSKGEYSYYEGHPEPAIEFDDKNILVDFIVDEFDENFQPPPPEKSLTINKTELSKVVVRVKEELLAFQKRLEIINETEKLNIEDIGNLLIWGDEAKQ